MTVTLGTKPVGEVRYVSPEYDVKEGEIYYLIIERGVFGATYEVSEKEVAEVLWSELEIKGDKPLYISITLTKTISPYPYVYAYEFYGEVMAEKGPESTLYSVIVTLILAIILMALAIIIVFPEVRHAIFVTVPKVIERVVEAPWFPILMILIIVFLILAIVKRRL